MVKISGWSTNTVADIDENAGTAHSECVMWHHVVPDHGSPLPACYPHLSLCPVPADRVRVPCAACAHATVWAPCPAPARATRCTCMRILPHFERGGGVAKFQLAVPSQWRESLCKTTCVDVGVVTVVVVSLLV
jgi:hypothetical protein